MNSASLCSTLRGLEGVEEDRCFLVREPGEAQLQLQEPGEAQLRLQAQLQRLLLVARALRVQRLELVHLDLMPGLRWGCDFPTFRLLPLGLYDICGIFVEVHRGPVRRASNRCTSQHVCMVERLRRTVRLCRIRRKSQAAALVECTLSCRARGSARIDLACSAGS